MQRKKKREGVESKQKKPRPKMWDDDSVSPKRKSLQNEKRLSKVIGYTCTPGSGNTKWLLSKGDGFSDHFMFECKETKSKSIRVSSKDVGVLVENAARAGKLPALVMSAYNLPDPLPKNWVAVPASVFQWILSVLEES